MLMQAKVGGGLLGDTGASAAKSLSYHTSTFDAVDRTTYTFSSTAIGTADASRMVIVGIGRQSGSIFGLSSCTIGGITADVIVTSDGSNSGAYIVAALVPTGTTADIVITFAGSVGNCAIGVWSSPGFSATTANDTGSSSSAPGSDTVNTTGDGFVISCNFAVSLGARTTTWTNVNERFDATVEGTATHSGADATTSAGTLTVTSTWSSSTTTRQTVMASW